MRFCRRKLNAHPSWIQSVKIVGGRPDLKLHIPAARIADVILELSRMSQCRNTTPLYKCTTIDPPGTIKHCEENGVEVVGPEGIILQDDA